MKNINLLIARENIHLDMYSHERGWVYHKPDISISRIGMEVRHKVNMNVIPAYILVSQILYLIVVKCAK